MEIQDRKQITTLLESLKSVNYFTKLKPENNKQNTFTVPIKVSCYSELNLMVSNLLKTSIVLLSDDFPGLAHCTADPDINVTTLLEIALQLQPNEEMELLDELHQLHLQNNMKNY